MYPGSAENPTLSTRLRLLLTFGGVGSRLYLILIAFCSSGKFTSALLRISPNIAALANSLIESHRGKLRRNSLARIPSSLAFIPWMSVVCGLPPLTSLSPKPHKLDLQRFGPLSRSV